MNKNFTLAVDTLGSETKVSDILKGLNQSLLRNINFNFLIFGCKSEISKYLKKYPRLNQVTKMFYNPTRFWYFLGLIIVMDLEGRRPYIFS